MPFTTKPFIPMRVCLNGTPAPLLTLVTTREARDSGAQGPGKVHGDRCRTGPEARVWRLSELRRNFRHRQIQPCAQRKSSVLHSTPGSCSVSAHTHPETGAHYLLMQFLLSWGSFSHKEVLSFAGTHICHCSSSHLRPCHWPPLPRESL